MADVPLGRADYYRSVAKEARIETRNRYFEANPILTATGVALIARPALRNWLAVGAGPIRATYSQPGAFDDALFVVSGTTLYRVEKTGALSTILTGLNGGDSIISMAATGTIGDTPEFLFIADGASLYIYIENGFATVTSYGSPANTNVFRIGSVFYRFTTGLVDTGTPAGTSANPWLVAVGVDDLASWQNFFDAIGASGAAGSEYSTFTSANPDVVPIGITSAGITIRASAVGTAGNSVIVSPNSGAFGWLTTPGTLGGGGSPTVYPVLTPGNVGIISVGYIASYVVAVPAQGEGINGRFFWINPGETTIDPLDFATAERAPDAISGVVVFSDQFWLPGQDTTEVWYFTGNADSPVLRVQGITFDRGAWPGTAVQVKESMMIVDSDGAVFQVQGGLKRVSTPDIEEQIREAIQLQQLYEG